jgi:hypothetical protein
LPPFVDLTKFIKNGENTGTVFAKNVVVNSLDKYAKGSMFYRHKGRAVSLKQAIINTAGSSIKLLSE